jgi:PAS domain S-box-containing protein
LIDSLARATTLQQVYDGALDAIGSALGAPRSSILLFDEKDFMDFVAWRGLSDDYRRTVNGHTPWRPDTPDPKPIGVADVTADPSLAKYDQIFAAEGIRALAFFPLTYRDRVIGKFMLYWSEPHELTADEIDLAQTIAAQIAFGVTRIRTEQELERERERLHAIITNVPGAVWEVVEENGERSITYLSPQIETLLGYKPEEWYRNPDFWRQVVVAPDEALVERMRREGRAENRYAMRTRDGRLIWVEVRASYRNIGNTRVSRGVTMDITAQYAAERREHFLSESSALLTSSFDYEPALQRIVAMAVPDIASWCALDLCDEVGELQRIAEAGDEPHDTFVQNIPLIAAGRTLGVLSLASSDNELATEIARRIAYTVSNAHLYREAQEANRAKDEFLATLSHELRTPLTATLGWATMLRMGDLSEENFKIAVETIERSIKSQTKLIDDILDVSRIVTGKLQLASAPVRVAALIEAAAETIRPSVMSKGLELTVDIAPIEGVILGDATRLQQVIWNLLSNSVKFTPPGGSIAITLDQAMPGSIRIGVKDSGAGIARKFLPFVFERFRQGDSSMTRAHGGLGLGLSIVRSIVELHGGTVEAFSEGEGLGATFTITLPIAPALSAIAQADARIAPPPELAGVSVLLVEDEEDTRTMLSTALRRCGARVIAVGSVAAALDALRTSAPMIMISDIGMPGEDGCSLMMKVRSGTIESLRDMPAIALTAYARDEDRERILGSGFNLHLAKPIDPAEIVRAVRSSVARAGSDRHAE